MNRDIGFYWVYTEHGRPFHHGQKWTIAYWDGRYWLFPGDEERFEDIDFTKIRETKLHP